MPPDLRKPLARMESRDPKSIRFSPSEWAAVVEAARVRGLEPSRYARQCCLTGLSMDLARETWEAHSRLTPSYGPSYGSTRP